MGALPAGDPTVSSGESFSRRHSPDTSQINSRRYHLVFLTPNFPPVVLTALDKRSRLFVIFLMYMV